MLNMASTILRLLPFVAHRRFAMGAAAAGCSGGALQAPYGAAVGGSTLHLLLALVTVPPALAKYGHRMLTVAFGIAVSGVTPLPDNTVMLWPERMDNGISIFGKCVGP